MIQVFGGGGGGSNFGAGCHLHYSGVSSCATDSDIRLDAWWLLMLRQGHTPMLLGLLLLHWQIQFELSWQLFLRIQAVRKVYATNTAICMDLNPQRFLQSWQILVNLNLPPPAQWAISTIFGALKNLDFMLILAQKS